MGTARALALGKYAAVAAIFASLAACTSDAPPTPATPAGQGDRTAAVTPALAVTADAGDFYSCASDSDCIAVPRVGCCFNGGMEAVNKSSADAYKASFTCDKPNPICPQYRRIDRRQPECSDAKRCEMVKIDAIVCGANHQCPQGSTCQASDGGTGSCAVNATPPSSP